MRLFLLLLSLAVHAQPARWVVCYSDKVRVEAFAAYDLVVLDDRYHPPLAPLLAAGKDVYGYLSLGEVEERQPYFAAVQHEGLLRGENPNWKGSFFVDWRDPRWERRVLNQLIPAILQQGFGGLMLDTVDNAEYLETIDPVRNRGMKDAALRLIREIRRNYPAVRIILNRGFFLLDEAAPGIQYALAESVLSRYDFANRTYTHATKAEYHAAVALLHSVRQKHPSLGVLTLDYWWPHETRKVQTIYDLERQNGFLPCVATIRLDRVVDEPGRKP